MPEAIRATDLKKAYPPDVQALDGLSLSVEAGTIFGLLGPNGAGKSTTVKILTTLTRPDAGEAHVAGIDVLAEPDRVRRAIGVVGQRPGFDPDATGRENLTLQGHLHDLTGAELRRRVDESLARFGLQDAAGRLARTYSGGMQRRLDIAMGLIHRPQVLFLDEPTTGLDPEARAGLWAEIERLAAEERTTVLLTTHYLEEADRLAAELVIVDRGRAVAHGTPDALKRELLGDAVQVELAQDEPEPVIRGALARVDGIHEVSVEGTAVRARTRNGASAVPSILAALEAQRLGVASVTVARPSLDDVYLHHAGRAFEVTE